MKKIILCTIACFFIATNLYAKEYLGFDLGEMSFDQAREFLKKTDSRFDDSCGYQGFSDSLPEIKVTSYEKFNKYGPVKKAWLEFSPDKKLFQIIVLWTDPGKIFTLLKDALDIKYGEGSSKSVGFEERYEYTDDDVKITLYRDYYGHNKIFGTNKRTALAYTFMPAEKAVWEMREQIDMQIKKQNAEKAGSDL